MYQRDLPMRTEGAYSVGARRFAPQGKDIVIWREK
jgi:hypothetical protein